MDSVEEVKGRLSIEDVISEYVQLKRAGRNFKGLSPFGNEKTPSFMVSPEKQIWHDFSSGKGGDMFSFVMEMEGLDFKGSLELLARKAGVDLSQYRSGRGADTSQLKERLYRANELATKFYQVQFSKNKLALDYVFGKRKFTKTVALEFRLGYSPNTGDALLMYLKRQGVTEEEALKAGLATRRYRDARDMFRGRLMIPLMDPQGQVIGFTARLLEEDSSLASEAPKYINTPQTLLYDKGRHVFGLNLAKEAVRAAKYIVVSEGNLDVIASHQVGVKQVVATAGTAMTESHLKTIARFTDDVRIAFDQDKAGLEAAERSMPLASKLDLSLSIITIPEGKDPDELIKKDPTLWEKAINNTQYALDWLIERYKKTTDLNSAEGKRRFSDTILATIRRLNDPVEQDHYLQQLALELQVSPDALRSKLQRGDSPVRPLKKNKSEAQIPEADVIEHKKIQDHLLGLSLYRPVLREYLDYVTEDMFIGDDAPRMYRFIKNHPDFKASELGKNAKDPLVQELQQIAEYVKITRLQYETLYQDLDELELRYEAARLRTRLIEHYVKTKKAAIAQELRDADEIRTKQLLGEARALDSLRRQ